MIYAQRPWKKNLPASLQDYQFDATSIPQNLSELFDKAVHDFQMRLHLVWFCLRASQRH